MHSTSRKVFTAALLALPFAAAMVAQPASAAPRFHEHRAEFHHRFHEHRFFRADHRAPRVKVVTPDNGARVPDHGRTHISARLSDDRSGIDARTVHLRVDGRDVTRFARVTPAEVRVAENLRPGHHTAQVQVSDRAGNTTRTAWTFDVARWPHRG